VLATAVTTGAYVLPAGNGALVGTRVGGIYPDFVGILVDGFEVGGE
jgi:hypothetical protein